MIGAVNLPLARLGRPLAVAALLTGCANNLPVADGAAFPPSLAAPEPSPSSAPSPSGPGSAPSADPGVCPASGVRPESDGVDAAMGLRALGLELVNCSDKTYRVNGYPALRALDDERGPLDVQIRHGITEIASIPGWDGPPGPVVLKPGERAVAVVVWRNTYDDIRKPPVEVTYLEVAPLAGRPALTVTPQSRLDLGSTGRIAVSRWRHGPTSATPATPRR